MRSVFSLLMMALLWLSPARSQNQWEIMNEGTGVQMWTADFINGDTGWIAGRNLVCRTTDGGKNWVRYVPEGDWDLQKIDFVNDSLGWAIATNDELIGRAILKTMDGGQHWILQKTTNYGLNNLYGLSEYVVYAAGGKGILKTLNGGSEWTDISPATGSFFTSACFLNPDTGTIAGTDSAGTNGILLKTGDGGDTWFETVIPEYDKIYSAAYINDSTGYFIASDGTGRYYICKTSGGFQNWSVVTERYAPIHACRFFSKNLILSIMEEGGTVNILKSSDGGITWGNTYPERISFRMGFDMIFNSSNTGYILARGTSGNILLKSDDQGSSWADLHVTIPFKHIWFINSSTGFVGGGERLAHCEFGHVLTTGDGGKTWKACNSIPEYFYPESLLFTDDLRGFIIGVYNKEIILYQTLDGGKNWFKKEFKGSLNLTSFILQLYFVNEEYGYLTDGSLLYKTKDGGDSWDLLLQDDQKHNSIFFIDENTGWLSRDEFKILKYTAPSTLKEVATGIFKIEKIYFSSRENGWILGGNHVDNDFIPVLARSQDGGASWNKIPGFKYLIHDMYFTHKQHGWAVGEDEQYRGVILETKNGGDSWNVQADSLSGPLRTVHFKDGNAWTAGDNGLILKLEYDQYWIAGVSMSNAHYLIPGEDTVFLSMDVVNPGDYPLQSFSVIKSQDGTVKDTIIMLDTGDDTWEGNWPVITGNRFYTVEVHLSRTDTSINNFSCDGPGFTTVGPLVFHDLNITSDDTLPGPGDSLTFSVTLKNEGLEGLVTNISARLTIPDPVATVDPGVISYGDISPGEVAGSLNGDLWTINISEDCPYGTEIPVYLDISSNGFAYWTDTFSISVNYPLLTAEAGRPLLRIYPNPAEGSITIELPDTDRGGPAVIEFLDITGRTVYTKIFRHPGNHSVMYIDLSGLPGGIYMVKYSQAGKASMHKLILLR